MDIPFVAPEEFGNKLEELMETAKDFAL